MVILMSKEKVLKIIKELIPYVIILIVVVLVRTFLVTPIIVNGPSMNPTLDGGELMILNKLGKIDRYDIVVAKLDKKGYNEEIIKRVIGMPGDRVLCENGIVYVNGKKIKEEYVQGTTPDFKGVTLKKDEYFIMGDNRENSLDSTELGPFKSSKIKGTTNIVLFPFSSFGKVS